MSESTFHEQGSPTADMVAGMRALEYRKPEVLRCLADPYAEQFAGARGLALAEQLIAIKSEALDNIVLRHKYIDETLMAWSEAGVRHFLFLGAGWDARSLRLPWPAETHLYEIDTPAMSDAKRVRLQQISGGVPDCLTLIAADLGIVPLPEILRSHDLLHLSTPLGVICEGLLYYLEHVNVQILLHELRLAAPLYFVADYFDRSYFARKENWLSAERVAAQGEQMVFWPDPGDFAKMLTHEGYRVDAEVELTALVSQWRQKSSSITYAHIIRAAYPKVTVPAVIR